MTFSDVLAPLAGGVAIGAASALLLLSNGRIAGISGLLFQATRLGSPTFREDVAFVAGLIAAGLVVGSAWPAALPADLGRFPLLAGAGLLVGFGARLGSGCTSGHGVCGIGRLSARGLAATATFMLTGALTVFALGFA